MIPGLAKTYIASYFDKTKPHIKALIEDQLKKIGPVKIIMTLWGIWKKPMKLRIKLPEDAKMLSIWMMALLTISTTKKIEMPFNSLKTEFFDASDINDLIERMLAYIKAQTENPKFPESGLTLDKIMHVHINFHKLALTRGGSYSALPKWIKSKKAVTNPQNKNEESFKWATIAGIHHEEIKKDHQCISRLRPYENQYNWEGLEFPVSIKNIDKFEKIDKFEQPWHSSKRVVQQQEKEKYICSSQA